jgi:hypothetical protein
MDDVMYVVEISSLAIVYTSYEFKKNIKPKKKYDGHVNGYIKKKRPTFFCLAEKKIV